MAGGRDWQLDSKSDAIYSFSTGSTTDGTLRHWRRREVVFRLVRDEQAAVIDVGAGDLGSTSGVLTFSAGSRQCSRSSSTGRFVCEGDQYASKTSSPTVFYQREQVWRWVGPEEEYDPSTGEVVT